MIPLTPAMLGGAKRRGVPVKTLKKLLKKAGLKTSGKKAALTRRAKKARLMKGAGPEGEVADDADDKAADIKEEVKKLDDTTTDIPSTTATEGGRRRRKSRGFKLF